MAGWKGLQEQLDQDDLCEKTGKRHKPDWKSVNEQWDGDTLYLDVNCADCGRSGCIGTSSTLEEGIMW